MISGLGWSFRGLPSATPRGPFRKSGTEGSNPLCSGEESANVRFPSGPFWLIRVDAPKDERRPCTYSRCPPGGGGPVHRRDFYLRAPDGNRLCGLYRMPAACSGTRPAPRQMIACPSRLAHNRNTERRLWRGRGDVWRPDRHARQCLGRSSRPGRQPVAGGGEALDGGEPAVLGPVATGRRIGRPAIRTHGSSSTAGDPGKYGMGIGAQPLGQRCR